MARVSLWGYFDPLAEGGAAFPEKIMNQIPEGLIGPFYRLISCNS